MSHLPYRDIKPEGARDFYFAINATFRFIHSKFGESGWIRWLEDMAKGYFAPVNAAWKSGGLDTVAGYWRDFFDAEPGSSVEIQSSDREVTINIRHCPAIGHLRASQREIVPFFCRHCFYLNSARAAAAGLCMTVEGGNGSCVHRYATAGTLHQNLNEIREAE